MFAQKCVNELTEQNRGANTPVTPVNLKYGPELSSYRRKEGDRQRYEVQVRTRDRSELFGHLSTCKITDGLNT